MNLRMQMKSIILSAMAIVGLSSCVGNSYYDNLNNPPTLNATGLTDTIKVSPVTFTNKSSEVINCYDYNMNMDVLSYDCSDTTNVHVLDDKGSRFPLSYRIGSYVEKFSQKIYFNAITEGDFTVKFSLKDTFKKSSDLTVKIHAFYNWLPVAIIKTASLSGITLTLNCNGSYDTDAKYGGAIKSYLVYIDGEKTMEFFTPSITILLSSQTATNINSKVSAIYVACRDNDGQIGNKIKVSI